MYRPDLAGGCGHHPYRPQETNAMNWILGLKRLWLLASIAFTAYVGLNDWKYCSLQRGGFYVRERSDGWVGPFCDSLFLDVLNTALPAVTLSLIVFILGAGIIWVVRGFRQKEPQA
jgi:hypothetical protein